MNDLLIFFASSDLVAETEKVTDAGVGSLIIRLTFSLGLIIGLIYLSLYLLKKSSLGMKKNRAGDLVQILERCYISPKKGIFIVKIGEKVLALGVTESQINLLSEISFDSDPNPGLEKKTASEKEISTTFLQRIKAKLNL